MLAYDSNTITSGNSQVPKKWSLFHWSPGKHNTGKKSWCPSSHYLPFPRAGWFTEQYKRKTRTICTRRVMKLLDFQVDFRGAEKMTRRHWDRITQIGRAFTINFCCNRETRVAKCLAQIQIRISLARNAAKERTGVDWKQDTLLYQHTPP